eukprot:UN06640
MINEKIDNMATFTNNLIFSSKTESQISLFIVFILFTSSFFKKSC